MGARPRSPPALAVLPSIQCAGLAGRPQPHAALGWDRRAGSSAVDPGRHWTTVHSMAQTHTNSRRHKRPPRRAAAQRQCRRLPGTRSPRMITTIFITLLVASPRSPKLTFLNCHADIPNPLARRCVLTPTHTHTHTPRQNSSPQEAPPHSHLLQIFFSQVTIS